MKISNLLAGLELYFATDIIIQTKFLVHRELVYLNDCGSPSLADIIVMEFRVPTLYSAKSLA